MKTTIDYNKIELLVLDVDGVMTDGKIILTPDGDEIKEFHVRDGSGMKYWQRMGKKIAIISGRGSPAIERRAHDLGVDCIRTMAKDKLPVYAAVLEELKLTPDQSAVMGDDLPDLPLMRSCLLPITVPDAPAEVQEAAAYVTVARAGNGAVREAIEFILKKTGQWQNVLARYQTSIEGKK